VAELCQSAFFSFRLWICESSSAMFVPPAKFFGFHLQFKNFFKILFSSNI
jgi:hypothetical protein